MIHLVYTIAIDYGNYFSPQLLIPSIGQHVQARISNVYVCAFATKHNMGIDSHNQGWTLTYFETCPVGQVRVILICLK